MHQSKVGSENWLIQRFIYIYWYVEIFFPCLSLFSLPPPTPPYCYAQIILEGLIINKFKVKKQKKYILPFYLKTIKIVYLGNKILLLDWSNMHNNLNIPQNVFIQIIFCSLWTWKTSVELLMHSQLWEILFSISQCMCKIQHWFHCL